MITLERNDNGQSANVFSKPSRDVLSQNIFMKGNVPTITDAATPVSIYDYLKTLKYEDRPDYYGLYSECAVGLKRVHGSFLDQYEWEGDPQDDVATALSISEHDRRPHRPISRSRLAHKTYPFTTKAVFESNILML
ncbi:hypothetical protein Y032_0015g2606 [Ancylostoma ceylanicum]|nr:hypothetical protein Y032_0015g2606 [Ancylostoma ceylanicum]